MSYTEHRPREWTLEYDSNYDDHPPVVTDGPDINPIEQEVIVIEKSAYDDLRAKLAQAEAEIERLKVHAEKLAGALDYYADANLYIIHGKTKVFGVPLEKGEKARKTLAEYRKEFPK